jgi:hypothetical protein
MKCTLIFERTKTTHNNQLEMALEDGSGAAVALENCCVAAALGGGIGRQLKIAAAALGGGGNRRTCNDVIGISAVKAKGLLLPRRHQRQQGGQERMLPMQGADVGSNGKEICVLRRRWWWRRCGYINSVDEGRTRG